MELIGIQLNRLRNQAHFEFHSEVKALIERETAEKLNVAEAFVSYVALLDKEDEGLEVIKQNALTRKLADADDLRDETFKGLAFNVKSLTKHFSPDIREKAAAIQPSTATTNEPATLTLAEQILNPSAGASFADNMSLPQELPAATLSPDASSPPPIKRVAVIGAGLAGTHAALSALKAGHEVHLFDKHGHIAQKFYNQQVTALGLDEGANTISASETTQEDAGKEEDTAVSPPKSPQSPQELKVIAWHNYLQAVGEVFDKAEQQGVLHVLYESEATLAMLAEMRFDAIVVASGKPQSNADLYNTIKEAYITPVVRAAGALAGSTTITDCIRSGKLAGQNLFDGF